jgi:hypothetical protein
MPIYSVQLCFELVVLLFRLCLLMSAVFVTFLMPKFSVGIEQLASFHSRAHALMRLPD